MASDQQEQNDLKYEELETLFATDTTRGISESKRIISKVSNFDSFGDFFSYHHDNSHVSTCQNQWQEEQMSIHCFDCSLNSSSCICLDCFLKGNHKNHNYIICPQTVGNCDCGDTSLWKRTGFCKHHRGLDGDNHPENYIDEKLRNTLTDFIFKAAFSAVTKFSKETEKDQSASEIFDFVSSFLQFGDGFRRLIAIALTEKIDFFDLLNNANRYSLQFNELLQQLLGFLLNDQIFKQNFSKTTYKLSLDNMKNQNDPIFRFWDEFYYHAFSPLPIQYNIQHNNWDWIEFYLTVFSFAKENFKYVGEEDFSTNYPPLIYEMFSNLGSATDYQPNEQTQTFFNRIFSEILNCGTQDSPINNTIIPVSYKDKSENYYYRAARSFSRLFSDVFTSFKSKENLKFDALIDQLEKLTDISSIYKINSNENDKFISKFISNSENDSSSYPDFYFDSFHNGASFFYTMPLYDSFVTILGLENICKIKFARFILQEKYQPLRIKLGIITLKKILSFVTLIQSLTPKNFGLINMIEIDLQPSFITTTVPRYIPVFQLLLGLKCNNDKEEFSIKEYFANEMAKEFGLFDDFTSENYKDEKINETQNEMLFSMLYLSLLIVIERNLFNINSEGFIREQLIFALKAGVTNLDDLSKSYDKIVLDDCSNPSKFNKVLFSIASIKGEVKANVENGKKDITFVLKDDVKWNPISAIIPIKGQKSLLNNEISNHPQDLINIQEFEPEETYFFNAPLYSTTSLTTHTYNIENEDKDQEKADHEGLTIHLNEFLMTPTVLAICYHSLRINLEDETKSLINLNDHLSLNILILISKFLKNSSNDNKQEEIKEQIEYNALEELITKLRTVVFKYNVDDKQNATIENTINNKQQFVNLLNLKIAFKGKEAKSFIDVINEKGQIGKDALKIMSIQQSNSNEAENESNEEVNEKKIKKQRAKKLKEEIMSKYKNMISNYNEHDNKNNVSSNSLELTESIDSIASPTCSGVISGVTDVCSICATIKKHEMLSYPIYIYQTKFPFIVDKPPLIVGSENEISVACDDDIDYESDEENDESNQSLEQSQSTNEYNQTNGDAAEEDDDDDNLENQSNENLQSLAEDPSSQGIEITSSERLEQARLVDQLVASRIRDDHQNEENENNEQVRLVDQLVANRIQNNEQNENNSNENVNQEQSVNQPAETRAQEDNSNEDAAQERLVEQLVEDYILNNEQHEDNSSTENVNQSESNENQVENNSNENQEQNITNEEEALSGSQIVESILNSVLNRSNSNRNSRENLTNESTDVSSENLNENVSNESFGDSRESNDSEASEDDEIEEQLMLLNQVAQRFILAREEGSLSQEDFATAMTSLQQAFNNLKIRKELRDRIRFLNQLRVAKKKQREENKKRREEERQQNPNKPKRYTAGSNFVVQFQLCQHVVHPKCVEGQYFRCPIDRTVKNGFLPCFESIDLSKPLSDEMKESLNVFFDCFRLYICKSPRRKINLFTELIKSLSGLITTFEVRIRSLPDCLDSTNTKLLSRNLFLTCWYGYRMKEKPPITDVKPYNNSINHENEDVETRLTVFQRFIKKLIENDSILNSDEKQQEAILKDIIDKLLIKDNDKENYLFLRRVCLAKHFFLKENEDDGEKDFLNPNDFVEWDDVLTVENLSKEFNFTFKTLKEDFEMKPFIFSVLPKEFLHFALSPYNFPVVKTQNFCVFNLLDYNKMIENYDDFSTVEESSKEDKISHTIEEDTFKLELAMNYSSKHYPSALLLIGKFAPEVLIVHGDFTTTLKPFYLDRYGSPDVGFNRGEPLFLNDERYERFIDEVLSGDFSTSI